ncbi:hypothetical protein VTO42DRAFT_6737 [Malbranchea cinnamomea]
MARCVSGPVSVFVLSLSLLCTYVRTSFAFELPAQSAAIAFAIAGLSLLLYCRIADPAPTHVDDGASIHDDPLLLGKLPPRVVVDRPPGIVGKRRRLCTVKVRQTWLILGFGICALAVRVEIWRRLLGHTGCATSINVALPPFLISLYDYRRSKQRKSDNRYLTNDAVPNRLVEYVLPPALLIAAGFATSSLRDAWRSTVICPLIGGELPAIYLLQGLSSFLDAFIFISFGKLHSCQSYVGRKVWKAPALWAVLLLGAMALWSIAGFIYLIFPIGIAFWNPIFSPQYLSAAIKGSCLFTVMILSALRALSQVSILTLSFLSSFAFIYTSLLSSIWTTVTAYPTVPISSALLSIALIHGAWYTYVRQSSLVDPKRRRKLWPEAGMRWLTMLSFGACCTLALLQPRAVVSHPIDTLISQAQVKHREWAGQAGRSNSLAEAVVEYRKRYHQHPPPGFDAWYEYATNRSSRIIDDFDQIFHDLLPFRALQPKELRELTASMVSDPWNDMAAVIVRDGVAQPQSDIIPTHRWMIEGVVQMIKPFAEYLPDMDIAFNLNDECRVAVPWESIQSLTQTARKTPFPTSDRVIEQWPSNRAASWAMSALAGKGHKPRFEQLSFQKVFGSVARPLCSPSSKARNEFLSDRGTLCISCLEPHSLGQFVSDWSSSSDVCHQPDLAFLHGFFLSPGAFKVSRSLLPVFSQSKVAGFNDILYPSAWNYVDKVKYEPSESFPDPPYEFKEPTLFWRGATSEGSSRGKGLWKAMTRQRLVHLANNHSSNPVTVLLPSTSSTDNHKNQLQHYSYTTLRDTSSAPSRATPRLLGLNTSIAIVDHITRCDAPHDCRAQAAEFGAGAPRTDFQSHWAYRFLFDMDGAGFSGRFLPFLQSRSVPLRTALFRQWLDSRITPWLHFVPQDLRLHDVLSTLAYFAGAESTTTDTTTATLPQWSSSSSSSKGAGAGAGASASASASATEINTPTIRKVLMAPHHKEGRLIAEEGRRWAQATLRKEDMEIYMFRLLLEWGRLTDDRRDELGFTVW